MRGIIFVGLLGGLLAGCSAEKGSLDPSTALAATDPHEMVAHRPGFPHRVSQVATLPDRGSLLAYGKEQPLHIGASTWHAVALSEEHALQAITDGGMVLRAPNGKPIHLEYERHVEHPDGNWTWIGHPSGVKDGPEAILTFGEKAVFGSIPFGNEEPLELTMAAGRTWLVETDKRALATMGSFAQKASGPDFVPAPPVAPASASKPKGSAAIKPTASTSPKATAVSATAAAAGTAIATVDIVVGYTAGFAAQLGGQSQAATRLNFLVDIANQAYTASQIAGQLRLVRTVQVSYADATPNREALFELTGVQCSSAGGPGEVNLPEGGMDCTTVERPAALQPLIAAREESGADLVALVRNLDFAANQSCGVAWLLGGGQSAISAANSDFAMSIISDSSAGTGGQTCRNDTLAHETAHNMGAQHQLAVAQGGDDTNDDGNPLDPEEFGRFAYSFGYSTGTDAGNFYTIMAIRSSDQAGYLVFSNPRITACGGFACGVADQADNARTLEQTMPIVAEFRVATVPVVDRIRSDFDGDGRSDILWRNGSTGANAIWKSGNSATAQGIAGVTNVAWAVAGAGDFDDDGSSDILWRNSSTGANAIWKSANAATPQAIIGVANVAWKVAGVDDFDGDGRADILWRNGSTGANTIWKSGNAGTPQVVTSVSNLSWTIAGVGDFDGDGRADILWRNGITGANTVWKSGNTATPLNVVGVSNLTWKIAGTGDFDGDGRADILWRNGSTGANTIWKSGNAATPQAVTGVTNVTWKIATVGDFDGDARADILWRNASTGANSIWKSANAATQQAVATVSNLAWVVTD